MKREEILHKVNNLPNLPGVYLFLNSQGKIIYIGKGKNLRSRVKSYFLTNLPSAKTEVLVSKIADLEVIVTDNEVEALILESNLVKQHKPRYNISLKDDKSYPYIVVTNEDYPRVYPTRKIINDGSKYFGPYTEVKVMKSSLDMLRDVFRIRSCIYHIDDETIAKKKIKVCLDYHIKKCDGPCEGLISKSDYNKMIDEVKRVLSGRYDQLLNDLHEEMLKYSTDLKFEKANEIKQKISSLRVYTERQKVVSSDYTDKDILTCAYDIPDAVASIFNIRSGKLVGKKKYVFNYPIELDESEINSSIIQNYYRDYVEIPPEIVVKKLPQEKQSLEKWLRSKTDIKVKIIDARKDEDTKSLMNMCYQNALLELNEIKLQRMKKEGKIPYSLKSLQRDLFLKEIPIRIECFDISTLQGSDTVASLVVFENAKPKKSNYKKFIIKTVGCQDDFKSMSEVVERHYKRALEEKLPLPNLIMVDGGKGQLSSAVKILTKLGIKNIPVIGLAKRLEEIYLQNQKEALMIPKTSSSLKLLQHIRDEAHRFAITFHRVRRSKRTFQSELEQIKGIGTKLTQKLLTEFESIEKIKSASLGQLESIVGKAKAKLIFDYFLNKSDESSN